MPHRRSIFLLSLLIVAPAMLAAQQFAVTAGPPARTAVAAANSTVATRVTVPPVIDGIEDDAIWHQAQLIDSFRQFSPKEDSAPSFRTAAKVAYDDQYLYVFARMYDPHPDSIVALLSRRDVRTQSEWLKVMIDSYHDKRSGYEFAVNPLGVKRDYYTYNDEAEEESWDGVWDVATRVDSLGWTAEFRIPFNQLRFAPGPNLTMGLGIWRDIARLNERDSWPVYRFSKPGIASQLGEITGLEGLGTPRHLEVSPYVLTKNITYPVTGGYTREQDFTAGADIKYGVTSNLTLDGTVNPDFGQVESDPATLNLTNTETFLYERRPFFVEGTGIFHFDMSCNDGSCNGLFYSRRIGRQPQLSNGDIGSPTTTTILGAAKLTGRLSGGLSVGVLEALTAREVNDDRTISEPGTNYFATRLSQEINDGHSSFGLMLTATNRQSDSLTNIYLRSAGYTGGADFRHQFGDRKYELRGYAVGSFVTGSDSAIAFTQRSSAHYYQRPGSGLSYDPTRNSLGGDAEKISISKIDGGVLRFWSGFSRTSPGFEINDLGYLADADKLSWSNWVGLQYNQPKAFYRKLFLNFNSSDLWTTQGLSASYLTSTNVNFNGHAELNNSWWVHLGLNGNNLSGVYDDRFARGGPSMYFHPSVSWWAELDGDPRLRASPSLFYFGFNASTGRSRGWGVEPQVRFTYSSNLAVTLGLHYDLNVAYSQYVYDPTPDSGTFASLNQNTVSATVRIDATFTPRLTLQFYAMPYISEGTFTDWRAVNDPRAKHFSDQYQPYVSPDRVVSDNNFNYQELNANLVLRWEYRRGSLMYVVWQHGRTHYAENQEYQGFSPGTGVDDLFAVHPMNTFLIKMSYWLTP